MQPFVDFFSMIWNGLKSVPLPWFDLSFADMLLGMFVIDISILIASSLLRVSSGAIRTTKAAARGTRRALRR